MNPDTRRKLAEVSTATLTTALFKRGFRSQMAAQLALAFNRILGPGTVKEIIFPQFVIQ